MNILHIDSSPRQDSHSRRLSLAIVERLLDVEPEARIIRRDLGSEPIPHTLAEYALALSTPATLASPPKCSVDVSEALIHEVEAADIIVMGTPMYNYTIPSTLKAWIDQILRVGRTMLSTPAGKVGLVRDRPVFIAIASGGVFSGERANQPDFVTPYLSLALNSVGLKSLQFLSLQGTAFIEREEAQLATERALTGINLDSVRKLESVGDWSSALPNTGTSARNTPFVLRDHALGGMS